jgi:leucine-zipper of insertion element IS481
VQVVNDGATVTDVARRSGVARQTVHEWLRKYAARGLRGLADRSARPLSCSHRQQGAKAHPLGPVPQIGLTHRVSLNPVDRARRASLGANTGEGPVSATGATATSGEERQTMSPPMTPKRWERVAAFAKSLEQGRSKWQC